MTPERWATVKAILAGALEQDSERRRAFVDEACGSDELLRKEVHSLLAQEERSNSFLGRPLLDSALNLWQYALPSAGGSAAPGALEQGASRDESLRSPQPPGWHADQTCPVFLPHRVVSGRFRIVCHLASGGMSEVYHASDLQLQRDVAVKVVRHRLAHDPDRTARLRQEALTTARLNHPNIVTLFEIGQDDDVLYIVTELLNGDTLRKRLTESGAPPVQVARQWAREIACGLNAAHEEGIIHRDLKPENVFITREGRLKLLDFGIAKLIVESAQAENVNKNLIETAQFTVIGTPGYMAPEQVLGRAVDHRADIFAFGVILHEMLSGRRPGGDGEPRSNVPLPSGLRAIVMRCLDPNPDDRFKTTGDLIAALDGSARAFLPRWALAMGAGLALAAAASALPATPLSSLWAALRPDDAAVSTAATAKTTVAVLPVTNLSGDTHTEQVAIGMTSTIAHNIASMPGITVASQADTSRYLTGDKGATSALHDLGVALLLDLALERSASGFRMFARLHRSGLTDPVWTGAYTGDVLAVHRAVLADLPQLLKTAGFAAAFSATDRERLTRMPTASAAALLNYFEGRRLLAGPDAKAVAADAIAALQRAVEHDSHFVLALTSLSEAYSLRYQATRDAAWLEQAARTADRALALDATDASVHVATAKIKHQTGHIGEAIRELRLAVQLVPDSDDAHRLLGRFLAENGESVEAIQELQRAVALRPNFWTNHYTLGYVHYMAGRYQEAIPSFVRVTQLQPNYAGGYVILGASHQRAGSIDLAVGYYEHAARIGQSATAYANLGLIYYINGQFTAALASYRLALEKDSLTPMVWRSIGDVYAKLQRRGDATASYERAVALAGKQLAVNPRDASALAVLALCEAKLGRRSSAERRTSEALALGQDDREVLFTGASTYAILNQPKKALDALRLALERGYEPALARNDDDLSSLRSLPEFEALMSKRAGDAPRQSPARGGQRGEP